MPPSGHLGPRLIAAARSQVVVTVFVSGSLFLAQIGIARRFGEAGLGEYTATSLTAYLVSIVALVAVPLTASRQLGRVHERGDDGMFRREAGVGLVLIVILGLIGALALAALWDTAARAFLPHPVTALAIAIALFGSCLISYGAQVLQARLSVAAAGLILMSQPLGVVVAIAWDTLAPGIRPGEMAVAGYVSGGVAGALGLIFVGVRPRLDRRLTRRVFGEALHNVPLEYTNVFSVWIDRLVVAVILGPAGLGTYQAASALTEGSLRMLRGAGPLFVSMYGRAAAVGEGRPDRLRRLHVRLWAAYAAVVAAALIAGAHGIVTTLFGRGFAEAGIPLQVLACALGPTSVALTLLAAGAGMQHSRALAIARTAIPIQLGAGVALASTVGIVGAATAQLTVMIPVAIAQLQASRDPEIALPHPLGMKLIGLWMVTVALGLAAAALPVPWLIRSAVAGAGMLALASAALLGDEDRTVVRRLVGLGA